MHSKSKERPRAVDAPIEVKQQQEQQRQPRRPNGAPSKPARHSTRSIVQAGAKRHKETLLLSIGADDLRELTPLSDKDLKVAFDFLDTQDTGELTLYSLRERLAAFYGSPDLVPIRELKLIMGKHKTLRLADLKAILAETNELLQGTRFDPVEKVFHDCFDPAGSGVLRPDSLRSLLQRLGHDNITDEDLSILLEAIDANGDGAVTIEDFRNLIGLSQSTSRTSNNHLLLPPSEGAVNAPHEASQEHQGSDKLPTGSAFLTS
ncbi:Calmodulin [Hondaea fermentalgiana]|uniref:Calmodulin n=1 Tax=Hondaea fermentalgiana TaxID=2315210 RepID=A0A2R5FZR4_9STRA|nr:Calmodulin [Hondaea fermentalgiana]|eukprot:GBG24252.1 Calmodulin [Hondaea fermentalgiana]